MLEAQGHLERACCCSRWTLPLVSKSWRDFLEKPSKAWEALSLHVDPASVKFERLTTWWLKRAGGVKSLFLAISDHASSSNHEQEYPPRDLFTPFSQMEKLVILGARNLSKEKHLKGQLLAIQKLRTLQHLELQDLPAISACNLARLSSLRGLTSLVLVFETIWTDRQESSTSFLESLSHLTALERLTIHAENANDIVGTKMPHGFSSLRRLKVLSVKTSDFSCGPALAAMTSLTSLHLKAGELEDLQALPGLTQLERIALESYVLPEKLSLPTQMKHLYLDVADEDDDGEDFGLAQKINKLLAPLRLLEEVHLQRCSLEEIPASVVSLTNLKILNCCQNILRLVPHGPYLKKLELLGLSDNMFVDIPQELEDAPALRVLDLSYNQLEGLVDEDTEILESLPQLRELWLLSQNNWTGRTLEVLVDFCLRRRAGHEFLLRAEVEHDAPIQFHHWRPENANIPGLTWRPPEHAIHNADFWDLL